MQYHQKNCMKVIEISCNETFKIKVFSTEIFLGLDTKINQY